MGGRADARKKAKPLEHGSFRREDRPGPSGPVLFWPSDAKRPERAVDTSEIGRAEQAHMHKAGIEIV
jgi:hypothetical protein